MTYCPFSRIFFLHAPAGSPRRGIAALRRMQPCGKHRLTCEHGSRTSILRVDRFGDGIGPFYNFLLVCFLTSLFPRRFSFSSLNAYFPVLLFFWGRVFFLGFFTFVSYAISPLSSLFLLLYFLLLPKHLLPLRLHGLDARAVQARHKSRATSHHPQIANP